MFRVRFNGRGGQGVVTVAELPASAAFSFFLFARTRAHERHAMTARTAASHRAPARLRPRACRGPAGRQDPVMSPLLTWPPSRNPVTIAGRIRIAWSISPSAHGVSMRW
jgi:hypothetical protein